MDVYKITRLKDWKNYLIPFLLGFVFIPIYIYKTTFEQAIILILLFLITIIATASYGFLLNDIFDLKDDIKAGKTNFSKELTIRARIAYITIFLVIALVPWLFLPVSFFNFGLFILQLLLLALYSMPPFRLKRFVITSVITDALYNCVIMVFVIIFTIHKFNGIAINNEKVVLVVLFIALFLKGLRGILLHQLADRKNDRKADIKTFVTRYSPVATNNIISEILLPLEFITVTVLIAFVSKHIPGLIWLYLGFVFYIAFKYRLWNFRWIPVKNYLFYFRFTLNDFYEGWIPLYALVLLTIRDILFILILVPYILLFPEFIRKLCKDVPETIVNFKSDYKRKFYPNKVK
jgi:4-hydroxybenzoate polyprenyltransferase